MDRVEVKTVGTGYNAKRVVFLDGEKIRSFDCVSDDYAYMNAKEYADDLKVKIQRGELK